MSHFDSLVHWPAVCEVSFYGTGLRLKWDILVTDKLTLLSIRVTRPLLAAIIGLFIAQGIGSIGGDESVAAQTERVVIHIPAMAATSVE